MSRSLADATFWLAVVLCAIAQFFILRSALVVRAAPADRLVPGARRPVELLWALLPAVALAVVLFFTWRAMHREPAPAGEQHAPATAGTNVTAESLAPAAAEIPAAERRLPPA